MKSQNVVAYISNNCKQSDQLISLLERLRVGYQQRNISDNKAYMRELQEMRIYSTPALFVGDQHVLGFQENKLRQLLA